MTVILSFFESFRFVITLWLCMWIFLRRSVPHSQSYAFALPLSAVCGLTITSLNPIFFVNIATRLQPSVNLTLAMSMWIAVVFIAPLFLIKWCYATSWTDAMSRWILGICVERFLTSFIRNILFNIIIPDFISSHPFAAMLIICVSYGLTIWAASVWLSPLFDKIMYPLFRESKRLCVLYGISFVVIYVTSNYAIEIVEYHTPRITNTYNVHILSILSFTSSMAGLIAVVIFLFQYALHYITQLQQETALLELLSAQRSSQYETMKTTMEVMNEHIHNFKHQVLALSSPHNQSQHDYVQHTQELIDRYDSIIRTGNEALDIILNQHRIECARDNIRFSCMVDRVNVERIHMVDLYTIVGNALDNAQEYVKRLDDDEKKVIALTIREHGNMVVFQCDNYFDDTHDELTLHDGLPATTKDNSWAHGIGLKSIRALATRYGGDMIVRTHDHMFSLTVSVRS